MIEVKHLLLGDLDLSYRTNSIESDLTIIFIHGNSLNATTFDQQLDDKTLNGYQLIALNLPGHGQSEAAQDSEATYNILGYSAIIKEFIHQGHFANVILVGHSLGGHVAIHTASFIPLAGLVIFGTPPIGMPPEMERMFLPNPAMAYAYQAELSNEEAQTLAAAYTQGDNDLAQLILKTDKNARPYLGASIAAGKFKNEQRICSGLSFPLGVLHGEKDALVNIDYLNSLPPDNIWEGNAQIVSSSGHSPQMEQPEQFNQLLAAYLKDLNLG